MAFLTREQIDKIGFAKVGQQVFISDRATFYNPSKISMGSYIRIDDFCVFSAGNGGIELGDFVHIGCLSSLIGHAKIKFGSYCGLSSKVSVYSSNDDFSGYSLPSVRLLQEKYRNVSDKPVTFGDYSTVGTLSVILPGVLVGEGAIVGAASLVRKNLDPWYIYTGNPLRRLRKRSNEMLKFIPDLEEMLKVSFIQNSAQEK